MNDSSELYDLCVTDYLDVFGEYDQKIVSLSLELQRQALCAALGKEGIGVFGRAQSEARFRTQAPEDCIGTETQSFHMGRIIWEFRRLPDGRYWATRTARTGSPWGLSYQGHHIDASVRWPFLVTIAFDNAWRCPLDPDDPCELYETEGDANGYPSGEVRCFDEKTACSRAGVSSTVYVTDSRTGMTVEFGTFHRRPYPTVDIDEAGISVVAGDCTQSAALPPDAPSSN